MGLVVLALMLGLGCGRLAFDLALDGSSSTVDAAQAPDAGVVIPACGPTAGLIGHWTLDSVDVSGATVRDVSGNGHDGTLAGTPPPTVGPGRIGEGLDYTSTTLAWVDIPSVPFNATTGAFTTISLWLFNDTPNVDQTVFYTPQTPSPMPPRYGLWMNFDRLNAVSLCINTGSGECWGMTDNGVRGRWVHVVTVLANGPTINGKLYVDGIDSNATCRFGTCNQSRTVQGPFRLAGSDQTYAWTGQLDDVRVYDRELTPAEVQTLYNCAPP